MASQPKDSQQRSIKVDEAFLIACRNTGTTLQELEAKTLDDFHEGAAPSPSPSATLGEGSTSSPRTANSKKRESMPKDVLERRLKNYEQLRLRKLHLVLVERDRLVQKGLVGNGTDSRSNSHDASTPMVPAESSAVPASNFLAAPPNEPGKSAAVPPRPPAMQHSGRSFARSSASGSHSNAPAAMPEDRKSLRGPSQLEPLDFGDGENRSTPPSPRQGGAASASTYTHRRSSISKRSATSSPSISNTPRLPPCDGAANFSSNNADSDRAQSSARKSQRELLIENAQRKHLHRALQAQRTAQAAMLKEIRVEEQLKQSATVQMKALEENHRREERQRVVQQTNAQQAENRARRDELLRRLRTENAKAQVEMGELELEAKQREIDEVRARQQRIIAERQEQTRHKNEYAMKLAKEKQHVMAIRFEAHLEQKGLLMSTSGTEAVNQLLRSTASGGGADGADGQLVAVTNSEKPMGESEIQRRVRKANEERRFQEKHEREAQRLAAATEIAEQARLKALLVIQQKEQRSKGHMAKELEARDQYLNHNVDAHQSNLARSKEARQRQDEELFLYRQQLEAERQATQRERDQRVFLEAQLKTEDRMARDEWRRSVLDRSKRYEEVKQMDTELKTRAKHEAAEHRMKEIQAEIAAIRAGQMDSVQ